MKFNSVLSVVAALVLLCLEYGNASAQNFFVGIVYTVDWSPDGTKIAIGGGIGGFECDYPSTETPIQILDAKTTELIIALKGTSCPVTSLSWSPDNKRIAGVSNDEIGLRVWDAETGEIVSQAPLRLPRLVSIIWSPDGATVAVSAVDDSVHLLNAHTGELTLSFRNGGTALAWSQDNNFSRIVTGSTNSKDTGGFLVENGELWINFRGKGHADGITAIDWKPNDSFFATASYDQTIRIWSDLTSSQRVIITGQNVIFNIAWSPDGKLLASCAQDGTVKVWDTDTLELVASYRSLAPVYDLGWSPDSTKLLYTGPMWDDGETGLGAGTFEIVNVPQKTILTVHSIDWGDTGIAYGGQAAPCSNGNVGESTIYILNPTTKEVERRLALNRCSIDRLAWKPDNTRIVISSNSNVPVTSGNLQVLDAITGHVLTEQYGAMGSLPIYGSWSPDGSYLAVGSDGFIWTLDSSGEAKDDKNRSSWWIMGTLLSWSPDSSKLFTANNGSLTTNIDYGAFYVFDMQSGQQLKMLQEPLLVPETQIYDPLLDVLKVAWSPDGRYFAAANSLNLVIWNANTYQVSTVIPLGRGYDFAWSPDSKRIAIANGEKGVRIWDTDSGELLNTIRYAGSVFAVDWSPDGKHLAYGGTRDDINSPEIMITAVQDA